MDVLAGYPEPSFASGASAQLVPTDGDLGAFGAVAAAPAAVSELQLHRRPGGVPLVDGLLDGAVVVGEAGLVTDDDGADAPMGVDAVSFGRRGERQAQREYQGGGNERSDSSGHATGSASTGP